jgi:hypothetical protein
LRSAVVGVCTTASISAVSVPADVAAHDTHAASAVAIDSVVSVVIGSIGVLLVPAVVMASAFVSFPDYAGIPTVANLPFWCFHQFWGSAVVGVP